MWTHRLNSKDFFYPRAIYNEFINLYWFWRFYQFILFLVILSSILYVYLIQYLGRYWSILVDLDRFLFQGITIITNGHVTIKIITIIVPTRFSPIAVITIVRQSVTHHIFQLQNHQSLLKISALFPFLVGLKSRDVTFIWAKWKRNWVDLKPKLKL